MLKRMEKGVSVRLAMGLLGLSLVTGCSSDTERKQANRDFDRITSYNVCYTKLLRNLLNISY